MLGIQAIKTTPYHPQTDGMVERFNQTLKGMLRKFDQATLLSNYHKIVRFRDHWIPWKKPGRETNLKNIVSYILKMRDKMDTMAELMTPIWPRLRNSKKTCINSLNRRECWMWVRKCNYSSQCQTVVCLPSGRAPMRYWERWVIPIMRYVCLIDGGKTSLSCTLAGQNRPTVRQIC